MVAEETTAVGAAERAAKVAAAKLAFDTAMADAAPSAPLDPFQQMMQSSIASLNTALAVLQGTLAEARAENLALKTEVSKMKEGTTPSEGDLTADVDGDKNKDKELKRLDRKDVDKPGKYGGNADHWLQWSKSFKKFLKRQDTRWPAILDAVELRPWSPLERGNPFIAADETSLQKHEDGGLGIGLQLGLSKEQFNKHLENYISGSANLMLEAGGAQGHWMLGDS